MNTKTMNREVKRYDPVNSDGRSARCIEDADYGAYVEYEDYVALEAENARLRAELERAVPQVCVGCVEQASRIRELEHKMDYYIDQQPSEGYAVVAEVMTGCIGKLNWLVMPNFKNGTKLYVEAASYEQ